MHKVLKWTVLLLPVLLLGITAHAEEVPKEQMKGLDEQVQEIKGDVLGIAAELNQLEEKLLYPSDTQLALFVALADGETMRLDSVQVELEGKPVATHLYTFKELEALKEGGVQRIYTGNVRTGAHPLQVTLTGKAEGGSEVRQTANCTINKEVGPKVVELTLSGTSITCTDR